MSSDYTPPDSDTYNPTIQLPADGDDADAASVNAALEAIQQSIAFLKQHKATKDEGTQIISVATTFNQAISFTGQVTFSNNVVHNGVNRVVENEPTAVSPTAATQLLDPEQNYQFNLSTPTGVGGAHVVRLKVAGMVNNQICILAFTDLDVGHNPIDWYEIQNEGSGTFFTFDNGGVTPSDHLADYEGGPSPTPTYSFGDPEYDPPVATFAKFQFRTSDNLWHFIGGAGYCRPL